MSPLVSVVIPVYNAAGTLGDCLDALRSQSVRGFAFETIVVDDGSSDGSAGIARRSGVHVVEQENAGAAAARNRGVQEARGRWVAFTDADCIPSRRWLLHLVRKVEDLGPDALGVAGRIVGYQSDSPAARFVDLSGGLDSERHLAHPVFPFPISANVLYRRQALLEVGGFDTRFATYEACDLHHRLRGAWIRPFGFEPRALVLHRHRASWRGYWRQQVAYGRGYAQLFLRYPGELPWSPARELRAWLKLGALVPGALVGRGDRLLVRRGTFLKQLAQRIGFVRSYFSSSERARWDVPAAPLADEDTQAAERREAAV